MSLKVRQLVKKLSGIFKDKPMAPPTPNPYLVYYGPAQLPPLPFAPIFRIPKDLPPSVEIINLLHQLLCIDHLIDLIDTICKDDFPISWDDRWYKQPEESVADHLAMRLWTHLESSP